MRIREHAFDWIALAGLTAVPITVFWQCATSLAEQGAASGGPMENAAFFPRIVATAMTILAVIHAGRLISGRVSGTSPLTAGIATGRALVAAAFFVAYLIVLPYSGFHLATPLLCFALFRLFQAGLLTSLTGTVILWIGSAFVFEGVLNVVLPVGVFNLTLFG